MSNQADITEAPGGSPMNVDPSDDTSAVVESKTPGPNCEPVGKRSDLSIEKRGLFCQSYGGQLSTTPGAAGGKWACYFAITVHNNGPDDFTGALTVKDTFLGFTPLPPSPVFIPPVCASDGGGGYDCTTAGTIPSGHTAGPLVVGVLVPDDGQTCDITNQAAITAPAGGSLQNTNSGNDTAQASLHIPSIKCAQAQQIKVCPVQSRMPDGGCCPDGGTWNGRACSNGQVAPPPPPRKVCPAGTHGTYPNCVANVCPQGTFGRYPNCVKQPPVRKVCPAGTHGRYPNCVTRTPPVRKAVPGGNPWALPELREERVPAGDLWAVPELREAAAGPQSVPGGNPWALPELREERVPAGDVWAVPELREAADDRADTPDQPEFEAAGSADPADHQVARMDRTTT